MPTTRRLVATAAFTGVAALGLAGCQTSPGAAAVVGNHRITDSQLTEHVRAALADPAFASKVNNKAAFTRAELSSQIQLLLFQAAAARQGVNVTSQQVQAQIAQYVQQAGSRKALDSEAAAQGTPPSDLALNIEINMLVDGLARKAGVADPTSQAAGQQVNQIAVQALVDETKKVGVRTDPRYGTWVPSHVSIEPQLSTIAHPAA